MRATTPTFTASYPKLFTAEVNKLSGKEEFSVVALFEKDADISNLKDAAKAALVKKFGADENAWPKNLKTPFRDQADRAKNVDGRQVMPEGYVEGAIFLNLKSKEKPGLVDQNVQDIIDPKEVYAGCKLRATINAYAYSHGGNHGVSFGLGNVQKVGDGEPIGGGRTRATDDFGPVDGGASSANDLFS